MDWDLVSKAIVIYTGYGRLSFPHTDDDRVAAILGPSVATAVLPIVHDLARDFLSSQAWRVATDLASIGDIAASEFRAKHPEISEEAVKSLCWYYTYVNR